MKASLWHHRLGHPSNEVLNSMLSYSKVLYQADVNKYVCEFCMCGKMSRQVFSSSSHTSVKPFERISSDVWGPSPVVYTKGYKYHVSFIDDFTQFTWIIPIAYKS